MSGAEYNTRRNTFAGSPDPGGIDADADTGFWSSPEAMAAPPPYVDGPPIAPAHKHHTWPPNWHSKSSTWKTIWTVAAVASTAACVYHGYKRNEGHHPVGWALGWGFLGTMAPVIAPAIALAQGFGKKKAGT